MMDQLHIGDLDAEVSPSVAAIRAKLLEGLASIDDFAAGIGRCRRSVCDYITQGMPAVYIGPKRVRFVKIGPAIEWLRRQK